MRYINDEPSILRRKEINSLCMRLFNAPDGARLLELLVEEFIVNTPIATSEMSNIYGEHSVGIREGQNDMIRQLHYMSKNDLFTK